MISLGNKGGNKSKKGFTLIELMVVISIISLLASIVLASLKNVRDHAVITRLRSFGTSVKHLNWDAVLGEWLFNDPTDIGKDTSGSGRIALNNGGVPLKQPVLNNSIYLDGGSDLEAADASPSKLGEGSNVLTIEVMINPYQNTARFNVLGKYVYALWYFPSIDYTGSAPFGNQTSIVTGKNCIQCLIFQVWNNNNVSGKYAHSVSMTPYTWHQITAVYDTTGPLANTMRVYFDGYLLKSPSLYVVPTTPAPLQTGGESTLSIGYDYDNWNEYFYGLIDELRIYTSAVGL